MTGLPGTCDPLGGFRALSQFTVEPCDATTFVPFCNELDVPVHCEQGLTVYGPDCTGASLGCFDGACAPSNGPATCSSEPLDRYRVRLQAEDCSDPSALLACIADHEARYRCDTLGDGFTCQTAGDTSFCGHDSECVPGDALQADVAATPMLCEGSMLVLCNAGHIERIDCTELGFAGCDVTNAFGCTPGFSP